MFRKLRATVHRRDLKNQLRHIEGRITKLKDMDFYGVRVQLSLQDYAICRLNPEQRREVRDARRDLEKVASRLRGALEDARPV